MVYIICILICFLFVLLEIGFVANNSSKMRKHNQLLKFGAIKYNGRNVLTTMDPKYAKIQNQRLQQPTRLSDGCIYFPVAIQTPHKETLVKVEKFREILIPKTFIATLRTPVVTGTHSAFYNKTRNEVAAIIDEILDEADVPHRLEIDFYRQSDGNRKSFARDKHQMVQRLTFNYRVVVQILCESESGAVMAQISLHQRKSLEYQWLVALHQDITRAVYVKITVMSAIAYLLCGVKETEASEHCLNPIQALVHADGIEHHPKTTMVTLKFISMNKKRVFRNRSRVSEVLPIIIAVGGDTQSRGYIREVLTDLVAITSEGHLRVAGGESGCQNFNFCVCERVLMVTDRAVTTVTTGSCVPIVQSSIAYSVCLLVCLFFVFCCPAFLLLCLFFVFCCPAFLLLCLFFVFW